MKKIFLYETNRSLLLFLLISDFFNEKIIYVFRDSNYSLNLLPGEKIKYDIMNNFKRNNVLYRTLGIKIFRLKNKYLLNEIRNKKAYLYGLDHTFLGREVFFDEDMVILEDGLINYTFQNYLSRLSLKEKLKVKFLKIIKKTIGINIRENIYGCSDKVLKIYGTENLYKKNFSIIDKKMEIINLKKLWENKTLKEKEIILKIFKVDMNFIKTLSKDTILLLTQPLSEQGIISEKKKIEIYSKIIENYPNDKILIKPHPIEETDYSKYFPKCKIMKDKYPIEILGMLDVEIKKIVTLFSTAAFGIDKNISIDFYGTEVDEKIFNFFGSQEKVMKRNRKI